MDTFIPYCYLYRYKLSTQKLPLRGHVEIIGARNLDLMLIADFFYIKKSSKDIKPILKY